MGIIVGAGHAVGRKERRSAGVVTLPEQSLPEQSLSPHHDNGVHGRLGSSPPLRRGVRLSDARSREPPMIGVAYVS